VLEAAFGCNDFDAFDVRFKLLPSELYAAELSGSAVPLRRGEIFLHWDKNKGSASVEALALWTLTLDLVTSASRHRGTLAVHRLYSQRDLQLDINLLTSVFPIALADAFERTLQHAVEVIPHATPDPRFVAAQAG